MAVSYMTEEERKEALVAAGIAGLSLAGSARIMKGAHSLGKAFLAEAMLERSISNAAIGRFLYGVTVVDGVILSGVWDIVVHALFGKEAEPYRDEDIIKDFVKEFIPVDVPFPLEFIVKYLQEIKE